MKSNLFWVKPDPDPDPSSDPDFYHHGLCVSSKRILQQTGQFGVPVRHVGAIAIGQGGDDVTQREERKIDLGCFFQTPARCTALALPL